MTDSPQSGQHDELIASLTSSQNALYAFILTLMPNREQARDVLQETNLVIWRKAAEFTPGTSFWAWATKIARYQVLARYRDTARERLVFSEDMIANLTSVALQLDVGETRRAALRACLGQLPESQQQLLTQRYRDELSVETMSRESGRTVASLKMALMRIRQTLLECIKRRLAAEAAS